jgi:NADPH2:quinone reductase
MELSFPLLFAVAAVNYIDVYFRNGMYPKDVPYIPGVDGSGVIHKVGK